MQANVWLRSALIFIAAVCSLKVSDARAAYASWVYPAQDGRLLYRRDSLGNRVPDFAGAGYHGGAVPIPNVPVRVAVQPVDGDDTANIQAAIDQIGSLPVDENGFRGAVLLLAGDYEVGGQLIITNCGVVLRGEGHSENGTVLHATGTDQRTLILVTGAVSEASGPLNPIAESYVPVGIRSFNLQSFQGLAVGATVRVHRPSPTNWLQDIDMWELDWEYGPSGARRVHKTGSRDDGIESWQAGEMDVDYERTITRLEGKRVFLDAPITCALEQRYGGGALYRYDLSNRIHHVGIENLRGDSEFHCVPNAACKDENHAQSFIRLFNVEDCWVRDVTGAHFVFACVSAGQGTKRLTVANVESYNPVSHVDGGRRYAFHLDGTASYCLFRNCSNRFDRHQFVTSERVHGPNVFVDGTSEQAHDECGPHLRWATGALWDNILVASAGSIVNEGSWFDIAELNLHNRGNMGTGQGWAGANCVAWNTYAVGGSTVDSPPTARNWAIGSHHPLTPTMFDPNPGVQGNGAIEVRQTPAFPSSLYYAQAQDAMDAPQLQVREYVVGDFDHFTLSPNEGPPIDAAWRTALGGTVDGFDRLVGNHTVGWTHAFQLDAGDTIVSATLWIALRKTGDETDDDVVYLNSTGDARPLSSFSENISSSDATVIAIDLADKLPELYAERFNVAVRDDVAVDWAILELRVAPFSERLTFTVLPQADGTVRAGDYGDDNFGSATNLVVKEDRDDDFDRRAFIRWDLSQVRGRVVHARVRLLPIFVGEDNIENAASIVSNNGWSEGALTWNNQPRADYRFASWVPRLLQPVEFNVTPQVAAALAGDCQLTIRLHSVLDVGDGGGVEYASREDGGRGVQPTLFVSVTNAAPFISDITNRTILPGASTGPIPFTVDDEQMASVSVMARSDNPAVVPNAGLVLGGSGTNRTINVTPSLSYTGLVRVTVTVSDGIQTNADDFLVLYQPAPPPPTAYLPPILSAIANVTNSEDQSTGPIPFTIGGRWPGFAPTLQVNVYSSNTLVIPAGNLVLGGTGTNRTITVTPAANASGNALIVLHVSDGLWAATASFTVRVRPVEDPPSVARLVEPTPGSRFSEAEMVHLVADARDPDNDLVGVDFLANGQILGMASRNPFIWDWSPPAPGIYALVAVARDAAGNSLTSAPVAAVVQPAAEALLPLAAEWRYFDSNAPPDWMASDFDDSSWLVGFAPIGVDNERCETLLNPGSAQITTFFRRAIVVPNPANFAQLLLRLHSSQGAVIYLNGVEVFRRYLPHGSITPDTPAALSVSDGKTRSTENVNLAPDSWWPGTNVLAVELHRFGPNDPTFSFDLELAGYTATALPRLEIARSQSAVTLRWPDWSRDYVLESAPALDPSSRWKAVTNAPLVIANEQSLSMPATNSSQLFRLREP